MIESQNENEMGLDNVAGFDKRTRAGDRARELTKTNGIFDHGWHGGHGYEAGRGCGGRTAWIQGDARREPRHGDSGPSWAVAGKVSRSSSTCRLQSRPSECVPVVLMAQGRATNIQNEMVGECGGLAVERGSTSSWRPPVANLAGSEPRPEPVGEVRTQSACGSRWRSIGLECGRPSGLGLTPPGFTMSPFWGLGYGGAIGHDLGLTPPGFTMSPLWGLGYGGRLLTTWGSRRQAVRCRPFGAGIWRAFARGLGLTPPGFTMSPLWGLGYVGRLLTTWGSRRQAVRCRPFGAWDMPGVCSRPGAHATWLYDVAPLGLGICRAFARGLGLTPPGCMMSPLWGLGSGARLVTTRAHATRLYDVAPLGLGIWRAFAHDLGLTPPGCTMSPLWGWDMAGVCSRPGAHATRLYDVAPLGLGIWPRLVTTRAHATRLYDVAPLGLGGLRSGAQVRMPVMGRPPWATGVGRPPRSWTGIAGSMPSKW